MRRMRRIFELLLTAICCAAFFFAGCAQMGAQKEEQSGEETVVKIYVGDASLDVTLADNASARAFHEKLQSGDVTITADDYGNFEKVGALGFTLPRTDTRIKTQPGDVILYLGSNVCVYYDTNTWDFTLLGKIKGATRQSMLSFLGGEGEVTIRFSVN